ncbi:hypothetical protein AKJ09_09487 [Labilithrix luteola]|uniref:BON domain-containing protein n=1 Tax=Labilithrix luteola TaxID=1391654 RepID=A0A0K1QAQ9_9BACT|nr:BON domain-containing protein [Labilithrix luteola]AKV02824.1 hypothetical protein AKJ09_09487 [Labilithrix luteola]
MTPRPWPPGEPEEEDLTIRDRTYESFGEQGLGMPTYLPESYDPDDDVNAATDVLEEEEPLAEAELYSEEEVPRGSERVDLGEPIAVEAPSAPRGRRRRDQRIRDELATMLSTTESLETANVEVIVHVGEITLRGTVPDENQRGRIEAMAERIRGVVAVSNDLRVGEVEIAEIPERDTTPGDGRRR